MSKSTNITWHDAGITKEERREQNNHHSFVLWFTGLSGSGKSTVANAVAKALFDKNIRNYVLDGDNVRFGLNKNLGFSAEDRTENIRRIGEVSKLFVDSGQVVLTAFISPFQEDRAQVREILEGNEFLEVYVECPLEECEKRDPKGLYKKARSGEIRDFTGIDSPYESPANPELTINTSTQSVEECVQTVIEYLANRKFI
ncbi:adenylyl-sulfate kinase [Priestia megaterium]|uniref:Adenylyl-sulfate kinase n=4 Tax=Priestia TaxID=2800373 RepID=A0A109GA90_PRIMG|nr:MULTISPECIES: adenylyl-sulfate kinase [Priestia]AVX10771.1 adenylyl-sulfate kinase [Bacillus sp. Y-01]KRD82747.1 adenylyl-sulfate kinase [Bacillus sp. Root147]KRF47695.1 adenylyl-sulfate kinase [Bacillus sp. Soil531]MBU8854869.1 adenylyl-sulfate kinase [Bacillus sp. FJAT-26377]MCF6798776.1 adenylyl-sulfate kinase [Bacillus sp. ET1]MCJ7991082.1 adenylyl-sulfate kinase [Priestia sp. OVS21]MEB2276805.1 adenylyl-sulfate kinase [Bacillus sp. ILBB4]RCX22026.1 adenylylsulfate kinase [Bacillus s